MNGRGLSLWVLVACSAMALTVGGCSREKPLVTPTAAPEIEKASVEPTPTPSSESTPIPPEPDYYTVQPGDTLWAIADRFEVDVQSLVEANGLSEPGRLHPGQELVIPSGDDIAGSGPAPDGSTEAQGSQRAHDVAAGETLWGIAERYGTTVDEMAELNRVDPDQLLTVGQRLLIP